MVSKLTTDVELCLGFLLELLLFLYLSNYHSVFKKTRDRQKASNQEVWIIQLHSFFSPKIHFSLHNFLRFNVKFCGKFPISEKKKIGRILIKNSWNLKVALSKIYIFIITLSTHDKLVHYFIWFQIIPFILSLVYLRWEFFLYPRLT